MSKMTATQIVVVEHLFDYGWFGVQMDTLPLQIELKPFHVGTNLIFTNHCYIGDLEIAEIPNR